MGNTGAFASNATMAKVKAKYGRMLTSQNYREIMACSSVHDVASYLKSKTVYADVLADAKDSILHRGNLEALLKKHVFLELAQLCRFDSSVGDLFFQYLVLYNEMKELLIFLRFYNAGQPKDYALSLPEFFHYHTPVDLFRLPDVQNFDDILNVLTGSRLKAIVSPFRPQEEGQPIDYSMLESSLMKYLYATLFELASGSLSNEAANGMKELFGTRADLYNLCLIWREKRNFDPDPAIIRTQFLPFGYKLTQKQLAELADCRDAGEALHFIHLSPYGKKLKEPLIPLDIQCERILNRTCRRLMAFSPIPSVVLASYSVLCELEIDDITTIIEGVRYHKPPEQIALYLTVSLNER